jgi:dTDP-4-dehydrorhamnose 3,5-epimerase
MNIEKLSESIDLFEITPKIFKDNRGYFLERYQHHLLEKTCGYKINFIQHNESLSSQFVLRGLHYQEKNPQSKLVTVIEGAVLDVVVDLRASSPTFRRWYSIELNSELKNSLFVPKGFAHGFYVLSKKAIFSYMVDAPYDPKSEKILLWNDNELAINWGAKNPIVSQRDASGLMLKDAPKFP